MWVFFSKMWNVLSGQHRDTHWRSTHRELELSWNSVRKMGSQTASVGLSFLLDGWTYIQSDFWAGLIPFPVYLPYVSAVSRFIFFVHFLYRTLAPPKDSSMTLPGLYSTFEYTYSWFTIKWERLLRDQNIKLGQKRNPSLLQVFFFLKFFIMSTSVLLYTTACPQLKHEACCVSHRLLRAGNVYLYIWPSRSLCACQPSEWGSYVIHEIAWTKRTQNSP